MTLEELIEFNPKVKFEKQEYYDFIPMENINPNEKFVSSVEKSLWDSNSGSKFENGDVLFARIYPCLDNKKIAVARVDGQGFGSTEFFVLRAREGISDPNFIFYLAKTDLVVQNAINSYVGASGRQRADLNFIKRCVVDVPSFENQQKIAGILSAYDELIENNKKRIALLETMAEELYKEWFVRFRFPNYENTEFEKAVPKDWLERPTSELFEILGGGTPSKDEEEYWKDGEINWFTPSDLTKGSSLFIENSELKCNETGLSKSSAKLFPAFSIMMTSRATIGVLSINTTEACTNQGFITCLPNEQFPLTYLYFWLKFSKPYFDILANGATFAELSRGVFKKIKMRVPTQDLIDKFDNFCKPVFDEILNIQRQTENLTIQKNQLLPRLISGKLSVEHLDI